MSKPALKPEGNGEVRKETIKPERLASLFSNSRDLSLTLGKTNQRAQTNKRSYAPNLNVARNKNTDKPGDNESSRRDQKNDRGKNQRGRGGKNNNVNFNNKKGNLIQSVGFLSEGIAAAPVNRRSGGESYGGSSRDTGVSEPPQKPKFIKRDQKPDKAELDAEQKTLSELLGDDDDDELNVVDEDSKTSSSDDFLPITIKDPSKGSVGLKSKKLETEVKIKFEPVDDDVEMANSDSPENSQLNGRPVIKVEPGCEVKSEAFHRMDKLFDATPNDFMLFQLPDTLPGRAPEPIETDPAASSSKPQNPNLCSLEHLEEGLIGKLVRYKSGKTKLVLGDTYYDVDLGLTSDFTQHAVTVNANSAERSANVVSLGQINAKYNVTPDWVHLFHKMTP